MQPAVVSARRRRHKGAGHSPRERAFRMLDLSQGGLILALMAAAPWLFGCTQPWSVRLMNIGSFLAGAVGLALAWHGRGAADELEQTPGERRAARGFLAVNLLLIGFCAAAWLNARATFSLEEQVFTYREGVIPWLPTTYDSDRTLQFLINTLAFFSIFWSTRFWIHRGGFARDGSGERINIRLKVFLWVFAVNGFLVALQGLLQRLSGSPKLLWFRTSYWADPMANFGPFSYRGNAADYLNLVWPVTFGVWHWLTHRRHRPTHGIGDGPELMLLPMFLVTLGASFATLSRGGILVAAGMVAVLGFRYVFTNTGRFWKITVAVSLVAVFALAFGLFGEVAIKRFRGAFSDNFSGRTEIYQNARQIAVDFPWFGAGPGAFLSIYHLYRETPAQDWAAFLHDDWLETRVTFGRIGFALVLIQFGLFFYWSWAARRRWVSPVLSFCLFLSIAGCLIHAKADFPFQTYGVVFTFVMVCVLLTVAAAPGKRGGPAEPA